VEGVVIMVSKRAGTVVVAAACVCGIVAACDSSHAGCAAWFPPSCDLIRVITDDSSFRCAV
jgi:hypothetical protein